MNINFIICVKYINKILKYINKILKYINKIYNIT